MIWYFWIICMALAGTYGDLSFLINRQSGIQSVAQNTKGNELLKRGHGHCDHQCLIDEMLTNVGMAFDHDHCKAFEHVQCSSEVIPNEQLCNNEGKTYPNHCQFVHDSCLLNMDRANYKDESIIHFIYVKHHGACVVPTVLQSPSTTHQVLSTTVGVLTTTTKQLLTQTTGTTTEVAINNQATTFSAAYILGQVFCAHKQEFFCESSFNVICGSDGKFYPNSCELSKSQCDNHLLIQKDITFCTTHAAQVVG